MSQEPNPRISHSPPLHSHTNEPGRSPVDRFSCRECVGNLLLPQRRLLTRKDVIGSSSSPRKWCRCSSIHAITLIRMLGAGALRFARSRTAG